MKTYFISGHRTPSGKVLRLYKEKLDSLLFEDASVVVGDYQGIDTFAQMTLIEVNKLRVAYGKNPISVTVYHMFDSPRNNVGGFPTKGGFSSDHERDSAMTVDSDEDIAFLDENKEGSGTNQNIVRRAVFSVLENLSKKKRREFIMSLAIDSGAFNLNERLDP